MLSEGKKKKNKNWSILMSSQDITLLLCLVISSRGDPVSASYKYLYYFQFLVFESILCRLILCTWWNFSSSLKIYSFCFVRLFLKIIEVFIQQSLLCYCCSLNFNNCVIFNMYQSFNVCPKSPLQLLISQSVKMYSLSIFFGNAFFRLKSDLSRFIDLYKTF